MDKWIIGLLVYDIIGFIYGIIMLFLIINDEDLDNKDEFDPEENKCLIVIICTIGWIILIPFIVIYRLYNKIKGGNKNE